MNNALVLTILKIGIPIIVIIIILTSVLKRVGIIESKKESKKKIENEIEANEILNSEYLNPQFHKGKFFAPLPESLVEQYARQLGDAFRWWWTDEELVYATYRSYFNKMNISQVSEKYYELFNNDLGALIANDLTNEEIVKLGSIIDNLPNR